MTTCTHDLCELPIPACYSLNGTPMVSMSTDDMAVCGKERKLVEDFKKEIGKRFTITDGGELQWFLGLEIKQNQAERTIALNQKAYIEAMAAKFGLSEAKPAYTPLEAGVVLTKDQEPKEPINVPYQEACGHVLWPAVIRHNTDTGTGFSHALFAGFLVLKNTKKIWASRF